MATNPVLIIICAVIVAFNAFLIFIYIKSKFNSFPYYFNIFFCVVISLNNIIRLIHRNIGEDTDDVTTLCKIQAVLLTLFDKLILALVCSYSIIHYLGMFKQDFYREHEKLVFIGLGSFSLIISIISTIIFVNQGYSHHSEYCYASTSNNLKKIVDSIITSILFVISLASLIIILINIIQMKNNMEATNSPDRSANIKYHICRFSFDIGINILLFVYILLIINKKLSFFKSFAKDLIYILLCLIIEMFFTINSEFIKETKRILTCEKINKENDETENKDVMLEEDFSDAAPNN